MQPGRAQLDTTKPGEISQRQVDCSMLSRCPSVLLVWCVFGTVGCITGAARTGAESVLSDGVRPDEPLDPAAVLMVPSELSVGQRVAGKRRNRGRRNGANGGIWQNESGCG